MKYYLIKELEGIRRPDIKNFNQTIDYRAFEEDRFPSMPARTVCVLNNTCDFGMLLLSPFPLFHSEMKKSLDLFWWDCKYREILFLDQKKRKSALYYLPFFLRIRGNIERKEQGKCFLNLRSEWPEDIPIIYLKEEKKLQVVLRLDLLESLMRSGLCGVELVPVQIQGGRENG
ncbi:MAG: hypothetical protein ACLT46_13315 [Hungatella sp.]